ncbi:MAG: Ca(2+)/H(+) antiporter [Planctomycetaceae bacterium]|nr:Ca(2+)/H(+) antiporter [Planctomycetaceae bacterium]
MHLDWLLVFIPIEVGLDWFGAHPILVSLRSALAVVPLSGLMGPTQRNSIEDDQRLMIPFLVRPPSCGWHPQGPGP